MQNASALIREKQEVAQKAKPVRQILHQMVDEVAKLSAKGLLPTFKTSREFEAFMANRFPSDCHEEILSELEEKGTEGELRRNEWLAMRYELAIITNKIKSAGDRYWFNQYRQTLEVMSV